jgi:site-specific recombinase XerD
MLKSREQKKGNCKGFYQSKLLSEYLDFLCSHRGLAESTIRFRKNDATSFLQSLNLQDDLEDIGKVSTEQVHDYIIKTAKRMTRPSRRHLVTSIRSFLKFCHLKGYVQRDLTEAVPVIGTPKLGSVPRGIPWKSVENLLTIPDRETHGGRRTYAVLQLLATYGLRIGQVTKLRLQDINWREGSIHFQPSKWGNPLSLPLYPQVAEALLAYIRETRGKVPYPEVFLTVGKHMPLRNGGSLSSSMKACFRHAGIAASTHAIRHAFATRLMELETSIKTIADLLGHKSISTTSFIQKSTSNTFVSWHMNGRRFCHEETIKRTIQWIDYSISATTPLNWLYPSNR